MIKKIILLFILLIILVGRFEFSPYYWQLTINPAYGVYTSGLDGLRYESHVKYKGFSIDIWYDEIKNKEFYIVKEIASILVEFGTIEQNFKIYQETNNE